MYSSWASVVPSLVVALRKESVDRNVIAEGFLPDGTPSLSARRAWIEIDWLVIVDCWAPEGRSPQGERG